MSVSRLVHSVALIAGSSAVPLKLIDCSLSMDEGTSPYTRASIRIARPSMSVLAQLDPALKPRLRVTAGPTTWTLYVTARQVDTQTGDVSMNIESPEAFLFDYAPTETIDLRSSQSTLTQVRQVLQRVFGTTPVIANGAANVSLPTYSAKKNLVTIPSMEVDWTDAGWLPVNVGVSRVTTWRQSGTYSLQVTAANSNTDSRAEIGLSLSAGTTYTASGYIRQGTAASGTSIGLGRARGMSIVTSDGASSRVLAVSNQAPQTANNVTRVSTTFTIPVGTQSTTLRLYHGHASGSAPVFWDSIMVTEGNGLDTNGSTLAYFDGSTPVDGYSMAWDGTAHLSTSSRTPLIERPEELYLWEAGVTAWAYLTPIMQAARTRLYNPGFGLWQLTTTELLTSTRVVRLAAGVNLYSYNDLLSRTATAADGMPLFADAVIVNYTWKDQQGVEQKRSDIAAPSGYQRPYVLERLDTTYPGPGTAAYILQRLQARRQQVNSSGAPDYEAQPSQLVAISSPTGELLTGIIHAVTYDLARGVMSLITKGLIVAPANSVGKAPSTQTIGSVASSIGAYTN